ncbi:TIGR01777 family oxidoreductase [Cognaticolwellia beringensis]|uniref:TIGR01777 family protein n=1 Tax=Cognaticolwellia beringensis TaxID=1967665 RepID=A0A222G6R9_9GAMM|nr:TIGR01777 family oxidoreductase [Cognaticolwellia beringensis]ASP47501.1 TIGR01777 family protein [Cognaticolwellia beringensis]
MNILITGGSGLIGQALIQHLNADRIIVLTRSPEKTTKLLPENIELITTIDDVDFNDLDVVVNLAGEAIVDKRWSNAQKAIICQSRWQITRSLVEKIQAATKPPHSFISGSAIGFYGRQGAVEIDESYQDVHDEFSHHICQKWEQIALQAESEQTRVCLIRTGIVLANNGGALEKMLLPFKLGLGGPIASGEQFMSWIHIDDMVAVLLAAIYQTAFSGPINATAPVPVCNQQFSETLSAVLGRPCIFRVPGFILRILMGESADLILYGQNVIPKKLLSNNFKFQYPTLEIALKQLLTPT